MGRFIGMLKPILRNDKNYRSKKGRKKFGSRVRAHLELGDIGTLGHGRVGRTGAANDETSDVMSSIDTLVEVLNTLSIQTKETTAEAIASTIGIDDLAAGNLINRVDGHLVTDSNNGLISTLGEDNNTGTLSVGLGKLGKLDSNFLDIISFPASNLRVATSLVFVTEDDVSIVEDSIKTVSEGKSDPGSREVHGESLVGFSSVLTNSQAGSVTTIVRDEESTNVEVLSALDNLPVLGLLKGIDRELLRSRKVGAEESITIVSVSNGGGKKKREIFIGKSSRMDS
jgi:hypothetical protein